MEDNLEKRLDHYVTREYIKASNELRKLWDSIKNDTYGFKEHDRMNELTGRMMAFDDMLKELHKVDAG